jgi:AcrR family transcriptional regulator
MAEGSRPFYDRFLKKAPQQGRSRSVVESVLAAAAEGIDRTGSEEEIRLQDVAERAGVGVGSLYDYFRDRKNLMAAFAAKITEDNLRSFEAVLERTHDMDLRAGIEAIVDHALETYGHWRTTRTCLPSASRLHFASAQTSVPGTQSCRHGC